MKETSVQNMAIANDREPTRTTTPLWTKPSSHQHHYCKLNCSVTRTSNQHLSIINNSNQSFTQLAVIIHVTIRTLTGTLNLTLLNKDDLSKRHCIIWYIVSKICTIAIFLVNIRLEIYTVVTCISYRYVT